MLMYSTHKCTSKAICTIFTYMIFLPDPFATKITDPLSNISKKYSSVCHISDLLTLNSYRMKYDATYYIVCKRSPSKTQVHW